MEQIIETIAKKYGITVKQINDLYYMDLPACPEKEMDGQDTLVIYQDWKDKNKPYAITAYRYFNNDNFKVTIGFTEKTPEQSGVAELFDKCYDKLSAEYMEFWGKCDKLLEEQNIPNWRKPLTKRI